MVTPVMEQSVMEISCRYSKALNCNWIKKDSSWLVSKFTLPESRKSMLKLM